MTRRSARIAGGILLAGLVLAALAAPILSPHDPSRQFADLAQAPPMRPRLVDADGRWRPPFVHPVRLVNRLERRYAVDESRVLPLRWGAGGRVVSVDEREGVWLPLGADALGRDVLSRLLHGARVSLGVAALAAVLALLVGALVGGAAGMAGGRVDDWLMRLTDFVLVLPAIYLVLTLRAAMPLVLSGPQVFWILVLAFTTAGWPYPARGVRAIVAAERRKEYAEAAMAAGAGPWRILRRHLLPATRGYLAVQAVLLVPAFILGEATLSFVGVGFAEPVASWGLMLLDAARVSVIAEAPWLLAPAAAIVVTILGVQLLGAAEPLNPAS